MNFSTSDICRHWQGVNADAPLVHCMTNAVVTNFTANALLASGCSPAMIDIPGEAGPFARVASAVLLNLGTPHAEQREAMLEAAAVADSTATPWVLDPVAVGALPVRTRLAYDVLTYHPTAIRGNPSEIMALAGTGGGGRGVDAVDTSDDALQAARQLAGEHDCIVAVSGATDLITDGETDIRLTNGHPLLTRVTGGGCALGALMAAFLGADNEQPLHSVAAATSVYTIAAEMAARTASGPGSFMAGLLDALSRLDNATINAMGTVE